MLCAIWLVFVTDRTLSRMPALETVEHRPEFLSEVQPQSVLWKCDGANSQSECEASAPDKALMPNGYVMLVSTTNVADSDLVAACRSYLSIINREAERGRRECITEGLLAFGLPAVALLILGYAVAWVRQGFAGHATSQPHAKP